MKRSPFGEGVAIYGILGPTEVGAEARRDQDNPAACMCLHPYYALMARGQTLDEVRKALPHDAEIISSGKSWELWIAKSQAFQEPKPEQGVSHESKTKIEEKE